MSQRKAPPPRDRLRASLVEHERRLGRLEAGGTLRGVPVAKDLRIMQTLRIGDVLLSVDASASPTLVLRAQNLLTGTAPVTIATLT